MNIKVLGVVQPKTSMEENTLDIVDNHFANNNTKFESLQIPARCKKNEISISDLYGRQNQKNSKCIFWNNKKNLA